MVKTDQEIDSALADEFAGYLKSVSKEIVKPIREEVQKQKSEIDRLVGSIDQAGIRIGSLLDNHREELTSEGQSLLMALDSICKEMSGIVGGVAAANEVTRERLIEEAASISKAVGNGVTEFGSAAAGMREALNQSLSAFHVQAEPWINQVGKSIEVAMESKIRAAETRLHSTLEESVEVKLRKIDGPLSEVGRLRYWLIAILLLQTAMIAVIWFRG